LKKRPVIRKWIRRGSFYHPPDPDTYSPNQDADRDVVFRDGKLVIVSTHPELVTYNER